MENIQKVADFIIFRVTSEGNGFITHLKLQKLLYYCQAWHLAIFKQRLFDGKFQAWIHGPVNRDVYDRFKQTKYMYSSLSLSDLEFDNFDDMSPESVQHIKNVLEVFLPYSDTTLENMTHEEAPWINARNGVRSNERCTNTIDENVMRDFYAKLGNS